LGKRAWFPVRVSTLTLLDLGLVLAPHCHALLVLSKAIEHP